MNHFTNKDGFNGISASLTWLFRAWKPPGPHPVGAYFTTLDADAPRLAARLRIPREKLAFVFIFLGTGGLEAIGGGRGKYVFFSREDYEVVRSRQLECGPTGL
jgi:hypothetical protein